MMYNIARYDALYGRQSVDKRDSISVESQLDFCKYETHGQAYQTYTDTGLNYGRTVVLDCNTGDFMIKSVGKENKII